MAEQLPIVIVEPDDGVRPVLDFLSSARTSLLVKQFTFTEEALVDAVLDRHRAGVKVRVMLNAKRSGGDRSNDATRERLTAEGVDVAWSSPDFHVTHEKSIVVDHEAALVATFNLSEKHFTLTRDYGIITRRPHRVAQIVEAFDADWNRREWTPGIYEGLLWGNANARPHMAQFIDAARHRLDIQHPKYVDAVIVDRLIGASERGVEVRVLCGGKHGISTWDILDTFASLRTLRRFGISVRKQKHLRLHAKLLIADDERALVGSMNIDRASFDHRRELGITVTDTGAVGRLVSTFAADWKIAHDYEPPDPLALDDHVENDFPHDEDLLHE